MQEIADRYIARTTNKIDAAMMFMADLMQDDPENFKQGYSLANAAIAASEVFALPADDLRKIAIYRIALWDE